ncbi:type II toxin-antitoxin system RelE family toxin [Levilactobacillus yiduensis]|uniref:type II toxin-antitoxin system RelE family toxin n=1 Tax=Levilactobacillus yiduensis TaxID=2953880 RepID=UPI000EF32F0F|nr:type II toxin-antitoxin system RelE/ParE family toxin [Levilactobacillus yiduensis]AYM02328.1 type II toxin-antitoxin system RelE/ParE family toxin [Levilactobacillus brevis]
MKSYTWKFAKKADKDFQKLDRQVQLRLVNWLDKHIEGATNPRIWGKALVGDLGTFWRYRVGGYRIIAEIQDEQFVVLIVKTAKRNDVYK